MKVDRFAPVLAGRLATALLMCFTGACLSDVPTGGEECRLRNAAICDLRGLQYVVDGPCPPAARTIRAPGQERCDDARQGTSLPMHEQLPSTASVEVPTPTRDLAWVGGIERWLLPALVALGGLLLAGLGLFVLRSLWIHRNAPPAGAGLGRSLLQLLAAGVLAVPLGYQVAGLAFQRIFSSFNNHDSAAPWLLAAPVGLLVFLVTTAAAFALLGLLFHYLFRGAPRGQGAHPGAKRNDHQPLDRASREDQPLP